MRRLDYLIERLEYRGKADVLTVCGSYAIGKICTRQLDNCRICTRTAKVIACIEDPVIIKKILPYLEEKFPTQAALLLPDSRAPPWPSPH
jgi:hypothetical protein